MVFNIDKRRRITTKCVLFKWKLDGFVRSLCLWALAHIHFYALSRSTLRVQFHFFFVFVSSIHKFLVFFIVRAHNEHSFWPCHSLVWYCFPMIFTQNWYANTQNEETIFFFMKTKEKLGHARIFLLTNT